MATHGCSPTQTYCQIRCDATTQPFEGGAFRLISPGMFWALDSAEMQIQVTVSEYGAFGYQPEFAVTYLTVSCAHNGETLAFTPDSVAEFGEFIISCPCPVTGNTIGTVTISPGAYGGPNIEILEITYLGNQATGGLCYENDSRSAVLSRVCVGILLPFLRWARMSFKPSCSFSYYDMQGVAFSGFPRATHSYCTRPSVTSASNCPDGSWVISDHTGPSFANTIAASNHILYGSCRFSGFFTGTTDDAAKSYKLSPTKYGAKTTSSSPKATSKKSGGIKSENIALLFVVMVSLYLPQEAVAAFLRNGTHFLFFGAYYCPFTAEFNPIWLEIQKTFHRERWDEITNFGIAKIQCGDFEFFCSQKRFGNVDGYPTINKFIDGAFVEEVMDENDKVLGVIQKEALRLKSVSASDVGGGSPSSVYISSALAATSKLPLSTSSPTPSTLISSTSVTLLQSTRIPAIQDAARIFTDSNANIRNTSIHLVHHTPPSVQSEISSILPLTLLITSAVVFLLCILFSFRKRPERYRPIRETVRIHALQFE
ncbi:hypothetical protein HDU98_002107 [Podochytrium sp. JEL0797]|nr:hypothetical protein HDU98_002107 [Podochytrium sp. JEL0797]